MPTIITLKIATIGFAGGVAAVLFLYATKLAYQLYCDHQQDKEDDRLNEINQNRG